MRSCPQIFGLAWSPNGQQLATVCKDGRLRVYEPRSSPEPLQVSKLGWERPSDLAGVLAEPHVLYPNRKAQGLRGPVEPALSGCVMVTAFWCRALTGEDSGTTVPQTSAATCVPLPQIHIPARRGELHLLNGQMKEGGVGGGRERGREGWLEGGRGGWRDGRREGWKDGWKEGGMDGGREGGWQDGRREGWMGGMAGWKEGWIDGWREGGWQDGWRREAIAGSEG